MRFSMLFLTQIWNLLMQQGGFDLTILDKVATIRSDQYCQDAVELIKQAYFSHPEAFTAELPGYQVFIHVLYCIVLLIAFLCLRGSRYCIVWLQELCKQVRYYELAREKFVKAPEMTDADLNRCPCVKVKAQGPVGLCVCLSAIVRSLRLGQHFCLHVRSNRIDFAEDCLMLLDEFNALDAPVRDSILGPFVTLLRFA